MTARQPRFEICRSDAGHHARFRAANGRVMWATEVYSRRIDAVNAVYLIAAAVHGTAADPDSLREVDERTQP